MPTTPELRLFSTCKVKLNWQPWDAAQFSGSHSLKSTSSSAFRSVFTALWEISCSVPYYIPLWPKGSCVLSAFLKDTPTLSRQLSGFGAPYRFKTFQPAPLTSERLSHQPAVWSQARLFAVLAGWLEYKCHRIAAFECVTLQPVFEKVL